MAATPLPELAFVPGGCPDCGERRVSLPGPLPELGDDFDWQQRDYDSFRIAMLEEMAARFPERRRWTPADMEVVLAEALAAVLDQLSDSLDRAFGEAFLETARRPSSVRRLAAMLGYDAVSRAPEEAALPELVPVPGESMDQQRSRLAALRGTLAQYLDDNPHALDTEAAAEAIVGFIRSPEAAAQSALDAVDQFVDQYPVIGQLAHINGLDGFWLNHPEAMERVRVDAPRSINVQHRMVTASDYADRLAEHPLVERAMAIELWTGSWLTLQVAVIGRNSITLGEVPPLELQPEIQLFHKEKGLPPVSDTASLRTELNTYVNAYRMAGQEVWLQDAERIGIDINISVRVTSNHYRSEVLQASRYALGSTGDGFFAPGRLRFGEDLHTSDIVAHVMALDGVEAVCLNRFKRVGLRYPDQADSGRIELTGIEVAVCDNLSSPDPVTGNGRRRFGLLTVNVHGGLPG